MTAFTDWHGTRHARITKSMLPGGALSAAQSAVLTHICYLIPYGESGYVSNADLARRTGYSEGYISAIVRQLAGETVTSGGRTFEGQRVARITRTWTDSGFLIAPIAPAELARRDFIARPGDQPVDPPSHAAPSRYARREPAVEGDQQVDPSNDLDHVHDQQQQTPPDSDLLAELAGDDPQVVVEVIRLNPGLTTAEFRAQLAAAQERPNVYNPRGLVLRLLANGQRVTPARRSEPRQNAPRGQRETKKPWDTPDDLAAYFAAQNAAQRAATVDMEAEPPDDATPEERRTWHALIAAGESPAQALNHLLTRRYQAAHLPPVKVEACYVRH